MRRPVTGGILLAILAVAPPTGYAIFISMRSAGPIPESSYWQGTMGNWLATIVGVVVGLPIALWLNAAFESKATERQKKVQNNEAAERAKRTTLALRQELENAIPVLEALSVSQVAQIHISIARWSSASTSGETQWLAGPELVQALAAAYESIGVVNTMR